MRYEERPDEWTDGPTCAYCRGAIPPHRRVCDRCRAAKGSKTAQQWLSEIVRKRSRIVFEHRLANNIEASDRWSS